MNIAKTILKMSNTNCAVVRDALNLCRAIVRITLIIINNIYCVPTHIIWLLTLWPLRAINKPLYYKIEGTLYHWLLTLVTLWSHTAGYRVIEHGHMAVKQCLNSRTLVLVNHQSTGDVPVLMAAFSAKRVVVGHILWIMDYVFKYTNFGIVSTFHQDFFIGSGAECREGAVEALKDHLQQSYIPRDRKWLVLFPEGGFLRKRRDKGQSYAKRNGLPVLKNVTLPRLGALYAIRDVLMRPMDTNNNHGAADNLSNGHLPKASGDAANGDHVQTPSLEYILDITIAYPDGGKPMDLANIIHGQRPACDTHILYRVYPSVEIPKSDEGLKQWIYDRYVEKEAMLEQFYKTNSFEVKSGGEEISQTAATNVVQETNMRYILLHLFFLLSTYFHWQLFQGLLYLSRNGFSSVDH